MKNLFLIPATLFLCASCNDPQQNNDLGSEVNSQNQAPQGVTLIHPDSGHNNPGYVIKVRNIDAFHQEFTDEQNAAAIAEGYESSIYTWECSIHSEGELDPALSRYGYDTVLDTSWAYFCREVSGNIPDGIFIAYANKPKSHNYLHQKCKLYYDRYLKQAYENKFQTQLKLNTFRIAHIDKNNIVCVADEK